jgi:phage shock protein PspC (stress-responsive transcriptional regulator)
MSEQEQTGEPEPEQVSSPEPEQTPQPTPEQASHREHDVQQTAPEPLPQPEPDASIDPAAATHDAPPPPAGARRLERSRDDRVLAGVCGGLGEYFGVDAVLIRIAALVLLFAGGAGALLYLIGWIAMPEAPETRVGAATGGTPTHRPERTSGAVALGLLFVALGAFFLVDEIWSDFLAWKYIWPIVLIAVGAAVLLRARQ